MSTLKVNKIQEFTSGSGVEIDAVLFKGPFYDPTHSDFGAEGDNSTDDYTPVQDCITAAASAQIPVLLRKKFLVGTQLTIPSNTVILGLGHHTGLRFNWDAASGEGGSTYIVNSDTTNGNTNISFRNFTIDGAGDGTAFGTSPTPASGVLFRRGSDIEVSGCRFYRIPGVSFAYQGVQRIRIINNLVLEGGRDGISGWWYGASFNLTDVVVANNTIYKVGDDGIAINSSESGNPNSTARPTRISIVGNTIYGASGVDAEGAGRGILVIGSEKVVISGNSISDTFASGIHVQYDTIGGSNFRSRHVTVVGNSIWRAGQAGDGSQPQVGIRMTDTDYSKIANNTIVESAEAGIYCEDCIAPSVIGNTVDTCGTALTDFGIDMDGGGNGVENILRPIVANNTVTNGEGGGIRIYYNKFALVSGNSCVDNGNAGDGTLSNGSGIIVDGQTSTQTVLSGNLMLETRSGASRTQTHGIVIPNTGGTPEVGLVGNYGSGQPGNVIRIDNTSALVWKRGNYESATGANNHDRDISGARHFSGSGTPEGAITAPIGSTFTRTDGGASTTLYVKESGTGNTGWVAK